MSGYSYTGLEKIHIPDLGNNPLIVDDFSLASFLGFRNKTLWYALRRNANYKMYRIPKADGSWRIIHEPNNIMKSVLQSTHVRLLRPLQEFLGEHVTAYRRGHSLTNAVQQHIPPCAICDAAKQTPPKHACPRYGIHIHMDLKDFFHSTSRAYIRQYFENLGYSFYVSGLIASLLTVDLGKEFNYTPFAGTPQGSPASGAICNLVADKRIDQPILTYLKKLNKEIPQDWQWIYSRYADDLTITCGKEIPYLETQQILKDLTTIIKYGGYKVNQKKTRITKGKNRKTLGIVFHQKTNIAKVDYLAIRALIHNCLTQGFEKQYEQAGKKNEADLIQCLRGKINFIGQVHPNRGEKLQEEFTSALTVHTYHTENTHV